MVAANVMGLGQAWQTQANTRINAAAVMPSAARSTASGSSVLTAADKIELMGVPRAQSSVEEESAADEIQLRLQQMTELAELSASDGLEDADRAGLQEETEALKSDINRIAYSSGIAMAAAAPSAQAEEGGAVLNESSHAWTDGEPALAEWSGVLDPATIEAGTTITVNNVTFEFVDSAPAEGEFHKIYIMNEDGSGKADAETIAKRFVDAISNDKVQKELKKDLEIQDSALEKEGARPFAVSCSWSEKDGNWTLALKQEGTEFQDGNRFIVACGKSLGDKETFNNSGIKSISLKNINQDDVKDGFVLQVGGAAINVKVQAKLAEQALVWDDENEKKSGTLYVKSDIMYDALDGSLENGLNQILREKGYSDYETSLTASTSSGTFQIKVKGRTDAELPELNIVKNEPGLFGDGEEAKETQAYLEFEVDLEKLKEGDSFNFRGMEFKFSNEEKAQEDNFVYIKIDEPEKMADAFREAFNECFAVKAPTRPDDYIPSTGTISSGATNKGKNQPWYEDLERLLASGVFEMRCFINGSKAVFSIYARTKEVLNDEDKIGLGEGEGWKTAESTSDAPTEGDAPAEAPAETPAEPASSGDEPAAVMALGISSVSVETKASAAEAVSTLSAAGEKLSAARTEAAGTAENSDKLRNGDEAADAVEDVKGQLENNGAEGVRAQADKLENETARKLTQE